MTLPDPIVLLDIAPNTTLVTSYQVRVNPDAAPGLLLNAATISATGHSALTRVVANSVSIDAHPDNLSTYKTNSPTSTSTLRRGDFVTYTIRLFNDGTDTARDVHVADVLPATVAYVPGSLTINNINKVAGNLPTSISAPDIPSGSFATVVFQVRVNP